MVISMAAFSQACLSDVEDVEVIARIVHGGRHRCGIAPPPPHEGRMCRMATKPDYYFNEQTQQCENHPWSECMPRGRGKGFDSLFECEEMCINQVKMAQEPLSLCDQPKDRGLCMAYIPRYFFNSATAKCEEFIYGGCGGNGNNFETVEECERTCKPTSVCNLPKDHGRCLALIPRFHFNTETQQCEQFNYGGCGGNGNNFETPEECQQMCM